MEDGADQHSYRLMVSCYMDTHDPRDVISALPALKGYGAGWESNWAFGIHKRYFSTLPLKLANPVGYID